MTKCLPSILCIGIAFILAGCTSDDPTKGGFFGGLTGLGSGAYGERVAAETSALQVEEARLQEAVDGRESLDQTLKQRRAKAEGLRGQVASLQQQADELDAEIAELNHQHSVTQEEVWQAETDITALLESIDRIEAEQAAHEQAKALGADADADTDPSEFGEPPREQVDELRAYIDKLQTAVDALRAARVKPADSGPQPASDPTTE